MVILTMVAEAPTFASLKVGDGGRLGDSGLLRLSAGDVLDVGHRLAGLVELRHALALGLFCLASVKQHEAIQHLASLRGPSSSSSSSSSPHSRSAHSDAADGKVKWEAHKNYLSRVLQAT